jgi:UvrD-like helicase C-terminal domain
MAEEDRALVLQDAREWRKHWDYYAKSEPGGAHSVSSFLGQIALGTTQQPTETGLALSTIHSAKSREFDVVFLMGMAEGTFSRLQSAGCSVARRTAIHISCAIDTCKTVSKQRTLTAFRMNTSSKWGEGELGRRKGSRERVTRGARITSHQSRGTLIRAGPVDPPAAAGCRRPD